MLQTVHLLHRLDVHCLDAPMAELTLHNEGLNISPEVLYLLSTVVSGLAAESLTRQAAFSHTALLTLAPWTVVFVGAIIRLARQRSEPVATALKQILNKKVVKAAGNVRCFIFGTPTAHPSLCPVSRFHQSSLSYLSGRKSRACVTSACLFFTDARSRDLRLLVE